MAGCIGGYDVQHFQQTFYLHVLMRKQNHTQWVIFQLTKMHKDIKVLFIELNWSFLVTVEYHSTNYWIILSIWQSQYLRLMNAAGKPITRGQ